MLLEFTNFHLVPLHMSNEEFIVKSYIFFLIVPEIKQNVFHWSEDINAQVSTFKPAAWPSIFIFREKQCFFFNNFL